MNVQFAFGMSQAPLWIAAALFILAAAIIGLRWSDRRRRARLTALIDASLAPRLLEGYDERVRRPLLWLTVLGLAALLLAFAQPRWGRSWVSVARESRDIMILLDTSESMNAQNPLPTRLERARQKIQSLLDLCPGDRFGLIAFAGEAATEVPLTLDLNYYRAALDSITTDTLSIEGTDITSALREARRVFDEDAKKSGNAGRAARVIILVTDGEQTSGDALAEAEQMKDYASAYVLGIGDPKGATITYPKWMQRYARLSEDQKTHLSRLDEENLKKLATDSGGAYVRISPDDSDVKFIREELEQVQSRAVSDKMRYNLVNRYRWPLGAALFCFIAEGLWVVLMPWIRAYRLRREGERHA
jgi:Ca-activated chloride channel family protein